ncbi:MAG: hypothetical protein CYPHOPRED_000699 [Cyphobasidiales sp. Tagirdzhanova-0007]|nr:MAG: hypothetical protein CYPHOPRED_000699 [Cyphobasidiales sp. Tagirdzhanova-0007]
MATFFTITKESRNPAKRKILQNHYSLSPIQGKGKQSLMWFYKDVNAIGSFFFMTPANAPVVYQTWGMLEQRAQTIPDSFTYGPGFAYREYMEVSNRLVAILISAGLYAFSALVFSSRWIHSLASKYVVQPGSGPNEQTLQNGNFTVTTIARDVENKKFARSIFKGSGDPGYLATSVMIAEAALAMIMDYDRLPDIAKEGGNLTPVTALGEVLKDRLEKTGRFNWNISVVNES